MPPTLLSQADRNCFNPIRLIATDMDGTLTTNGKFTPALLQTLTDMASAHIPVVIVTGRSAGWVSGLVHYLPVAGAIAENGGIFFRGDSSSEWLVPTAHLVNHRQQLQGLFEKLQIKFPHLQESIDNRYRLTDWTFDVAGLTPVEINAMDGMCRAQGWSLTYSTVQVHLKLPQQNKASGLMQVLSNECPNLSPDQVLTVGDSPNDESLFDADKFPVSVGVANVMEYYDRLSHHPAYVTAAPEGEGFIELGHFISDCQT